MGAAAASREKTSAVSMFWEPGMCPPGSKRCAGKSDSLASAAAGPPAAPKVIPAWKSSPSVLDPRLRVAAPRLPAAQGVQFRLGGGRGEPGNGSALSPERFPSPAASKWPNTRRSRSRLPRELPAPGTRPAPGWINLRAGTVGFLYGLQLLASREIAHGSESSSSAAKREQPAARSAGAAAAAAEAGLVLEQPASPGAGRECGQELASNYGAAFP